MAEIAIKKNNVVLETLEPVNMRLGEITNNSYNPNRQSEFDFELLCRSIAEDGYTDAVIVLNEKRSLEAGQTDGRLVIVDGEHRWTAMTVLYSMILDGIDIRAGLPVDQLPERRKNRAEHLQRVKDKLIKVVKVDMTQEQARIATLRHNRARGSEDIELSAQVLRDLQALGAIDWAQDSLMMSDEEMNRMLQEVDVPAALAAEAFSEAWEPEQRRPGATDPTGEAKTEQTSNGKITSAQTQTAAEAQEKIAQAKTEEEREKIREESKIHRLNLVFAGTEAELVEEILGRYPAKALIHVLNVWKTNEFSEKFPVPKE